MGFIGFLGFRVQGSQSIVTLVLPPSQAQTLRAGAMWLLWFTWSCQASPGIQPRPDYKTCAVAAPEATDSADMTYRALIE